MVKPGPRKGSNSKPSAASGKKRRRGRPREEEKHLSSNMSSQDEQSSDTNSGPPEGHPRKKPVPDGDDQGDEPDESEPDEVVAPEPKRPRGRPPGSKNKAKTHVQGSGKSVQAGKKRGFDDAFSDRERYSNTESPRRIPTKRVYRLEHEMGVALTAKGKPSRRGISRQHPRTPPSLDPPSAEEILSGQPCEMRYEELRDVLPSPEDVKLDEIDAAILKAHNINVTNEIQLWSMCWQRFQSTPYEIFKYVLWLELKDNRAVNVTYGDGETGRFIPPFLSNGDMNALRHLISMPCWDDSIEKFRYVLMCAVWYRIEDHDEPLVPIREKHLKQFEADYGSIPLSADQKSLLIYKQAKAWIVDDPIIKKICRALRSISPSETAPTDVIKRIFLLKTADLARVEKAITSIIDNYNGYRLFENPEHYETAWDTVGRHLVSQPWPPRNELAEVRKYTILNFRMEHQCRLALQNSGMPQFLYLVDIRDRACTARFYDDIQPGLIHGDIHGPTQVQLNVIRGLILPARGPYLRPMPLDGPKVTEACMLASPREASRSTDPFIGVQDKSDQDSHPASHQQRTNDHHEENPFDGLSHHQGRGPHSRVGMIAATSKGTNRKAATPPAANPFHQGTDDGVIIQDDDEMTDSSDETSRLSSDAGGQALTAPPKVQSKGPNPRIFNEDIVNRLPLAIDSAKNKASEAAYGDRAELFALESVNFRSPFSHLFPSSRLPFPPSTTSRQDEGPETTLQRWHID